MKNLKRVLVWALLSLSLQALGLFTLEKLLFAHSSDFKIEKVESKPIQSNASISSDSENVRVSFSGKYLTLEKNNSIYILSSKDGVETQLNIEDSEEVLYYNWIEGNNRLFVIYKNKDNMVALSTYDAVSNTEHKIKNICDYSKNMRIDDVTISQKPGVKYISISTTNSKVPTIYRIDINETITRVNHNIRSLGQMQALQNKDVLICYDDVRAAYYCITNGKSTKIDVGFEGKSTILGVDNQENVYFGVYEGEKISKIMYGTVSTKKGAWKEIVLESPKFKEDINITYDGGILVNDKLKGWVNNIINNDKISYDGRYVTSNNKIIYSQEGNKVCIKSLKDIDEVPEVEDGKEE